MMPTACITVPSSIVFFASTVRNTCPATMSLRLIVDRSGTSRAYSTDRRSLEVIFALPRSTAAGFPAASKKVVTGSRWFSTAHLRRAGWGGR